MSTRPNLTPEEEYIVSYYRLTRNENWLRMCFLEICILAVSLVSAIQFYRTEDWAFAFIAYSFLFGVQLYLLNLRRKWSGPMRSIFEKYDAKLQEMSAKHDHQNPSHA